jgi:two-component system NarL family response regulator
MDNKGINMIRVLVADDHHVVRQGVVALLQTFEDIEVVGQAESGEQAVEMFNQLIPDITLMDLQMPGAGGVEAVLSIRRTHTTARIIVLTTFDGDEDIYRSLQAGAKGYLLKGMTSDELLKAIRSAHSGRSTIPALIAEKLAERVSTQQLTPREVSVLNRIVAGRANKQIADDLSISEATVKTHINSLLGKLGVTDRTQAVTLAIQRGLVHLK